MIQSSSGVFLPLSKKSEKAISSINLNCNDIATIIRRLDPKKAHGHAQANVESKKRKQKVILNSQHVPMLKQEFLKVQFLDHYFS